MSKILSIVAAGILALLSFNSCEALSSDFDASSCDAYLTCFYAGGLPSASSQKTFELDGKLKDDDIEEIFYELCSSVQPGFTDAVLELNFYDWMGNYSHTRVYDFWWEITDMYDGDGYYAWDERID